MGDVMIAAGKLRTEEVPDRRLIRFGDHSFHRGAPATKGGWRWFVRVTRGSHRKHLNETRQQVQVYLPAPEAGW